ncbi:MAG: hypothetical protein AAF628_08355 [Planctomycetota bacterium]
MFEITTTAATPAHARELAPRLRYQDVEELRASSGEEPEAALLASLAVSSKAWAGLRDGVVQVLFGVAPVSPGLGSPWLLSSEDIYRWPRRFYVESRHFMDLMHEDFPVLTNFVDDRNLRSQRWLKRLGFTPGRREPEYGVGRLPFTQYTSVRT